MSFGWFHQTVFACSLSKEEKVLLRHDCVIQALAYEESGGYSETAAWCIAHKTPPSVAHQDVQEFTQHTHTHQ